MEAVQTDQENEYNNGCNGEGAACTHVIAIPVGSIYKVDKKKNARYATSCTVSIVKKEKTTNTIVKINEFVYSKKVQPHHKVANIIFSDQKLEYVNTLLSLVKASETSDTSDAFETTVPTILHCCNVPFGKNSETGENILTDVFVLSSLSSSSSNLNQKVVATLFSYIMFNQYDFINVDIVPFDILEMMYKHALKYNGLFDTIAFVAPDQDQKTKFDEIRSGRSAKTTQRRKGRKCVENKKGVGNESKCIVM